MLNKHTVGQELLIINTPMTGSSESKGKILKVVEVGEGITRMSDNVWYPNMYLSAETEPDTHEYTLDDWSTEELIEEIVRRNKYALENN